MTKRGKDSGGERRRPVPADEAGIVRPGEAVPERTGEELRLFVDDVVDFVNLCMRRDGLEHEAAADHLFKKLCRNDPMAALDPAARVSRERAEVAERAWKSLQLDRTDLSRHLRIGALNQLLRSDAWDGLVWTKKVELLPLSGMLVPIEGEEPAEAERRRAIFHAGVGYANRPNVGRTLLHEWVQNALPPKEGQRGLTLAAGDRVVETGTRLGDEEERHAFADMVRDAPPERRREIVRGLRKTVENLALLLADLEGRRGGKK